MQTALAILKSKSFEVIFLNLFRKRGLLGGATKKLLLNCQRTTNPWLFEDIAIEAYRNKNFKKFPIKICWNLEARNLKSDLFHL